jgi:hypothetical protein
VCVYNTHAHARTRARTHTHTHVTIPGRSRCPVALLLLGRLRLVLRDVRNHYHGQQQLRAPLLSHLSGKVLERMIKKKILFASIIIISI